MNLTGIAIDHGVSLVVNFFGLIKLALIFQLR
jgi:hypothetical protein